MSARVSLLPRVVSSALIAVGLGLALFGLLADLLVGGTRGLGLQQLAVAAVGFAVAALGVVSSPEARRRLAGSLRSTRPASVAQCLTIGAWWGLLVGLFEIAHQTCRSLCFGAVLWQPVDKLWIAPATHMVLFVALAAVLAVVAIRWRRATDWAVVLAVLGAMAAWSQVLLAEWLDQGAALILCGSAGWLAARLAARPDRLLRLSRVTAPWLVVLVIAATLLLPQSWSATGPPIRVAAAAGAGTPPNVVLIVLDTVRADHLPSHGYHRATAPNLTRFAEHAVSFESAISPSSWTLPAHVAMFTGRYSHQTGANFDVAMDSSASTLAEVFAARGYTTGGFVGNTIYCTREFGVDRGFAHYVDYHVKRDVILWSTGVGRWLVRHLIDKTGSGVRNEAETVTDDLLEWLDDKGDSPFFAYVNYFDAHAPYIPPEPYASSFGPVSPSIMDWYERSDWSTAQMQGFIDAYDGAILYIDQQLQRVFTHLRERQLLDNTLVIITSDHGDQFGEHGLTDHANSLYRQLIHVPLMISFPGRTAPGARVSDVVTLRDLPATILDLAGIEVQPPFPGHSLAPYLGERPSNAAPIHSAALSGLRSLVTPPPLPGATASLIADDMHYILNWDGTEAFYGWSSDPAEEHDLSGDPSHAPMLMRLRAELARLLRP